MATNEETPVERELREVKAARIEDAYLELCTLLALRDEVEARVSVARDRWQKLVDELKR